MSQKKTILILIGHYLPGYKSGGPQTSVQNIVEHLSDDFNFKIITLDRDFGDTEPFADLEPNQWTKVGKSEVYYLVKTKLYHLKMALLAAKTEHDILYLNPLLVPYTLFSVICRKLNWLKTKNIIIAPRGELFDEALAIKPLKKKIYFFVVNLLGVYKNVRWHATTEHEKTFIQKKLSIGEKNIRVAPIMTSTDISHIIQHTMAKTAPSYDLRIVYLSRISQDKNVLYTFDVLKQVKANILFDMFGPIEDATIWESCQNSMKQLPQNITVNYHGSVESPRVKGILAQYDMFFLPTFAENFGHAIAQSLLVGTPVLISDNTPWRNLETEGFGWDISLKAPHKFVEVIEQLAKTPLSIKQENREKIKVKIAQKLNDASIIEANRQLFKF